MSLSLTPSITLRRNAIPTDTNDTRLPDRRVKILN